MSKVNKERRGCRDVFHAYFVEDAEFDGKLEIPFIDKETEVPQNLISFTEALRTDDFNQWVHFYEDDGNFERLWNRPEKYLPRLKKFKGVISPDFSLYRDMPLVIKVIPNIRWGDRRTYEFCCLGARKYSVIAIGSHGLIKIKKERKYFAEGLEYIVSTLHPTAIVVYGTAPREIFDRYEEDGIRIIVFKSDISKAMKRGDD